MNDPRKDRARPLTGGSSSRGASERPGRMGLPAKAMIGVLLLLVGWRWYEAGVTMPVQIDQISGSAMILVIQEGDCPDRRGSLEAWVERGTDDLTDDGVSFVVSVLAGPEPPGSSALAGFPLLSRSAHPDITRALLRSGVGATPAVLMVDENGYPVLAFGFEATGPGPRARLVAGALTASADSLMPINRGGPSRWNP